jgi:hypothetical protein
LPDYFNAGTGSTVEILDGATVAKTVNAIGGTVNVRGGTVSSLGAVLDAAINIHDGDVTALTAALGSRIEMDAGEVYALDANIGSVVSVAGGVIKYADVDNGAVLNISGGHVWQVTARSGSEVHLFGKEFLFNNVPIDNLSVGIPMIISSRSLLAILSGELSDGSPFAFSLSSLHSSNFSANALLTVTLVVPEQQSWAFCLGAIVIMWLPLWRSATRYTYQIHAKGNACSHEQTQPLSSPARR